MAAMSKRGPGKVRRVACAALAAPANFTSEASGGARFHARVRISRAAFLVSTMIDPVPGICPSGHDSVLQHHMGRNAASGRISRLNTKVPAQQLLPKSAASHSLTFLVGRRGSTGFGFTAPQTATGFNNERDCGRPVLYPHPTVELLSRRSNCNSKGQCSLQNRSPSPLSSLLGDPVNDATEQQSSSCRHHGPEENPRIFSISETPHGFVQVNVPA
jgi:hypothetical protein